MNIVEAIKSGKRFKRNWWPYTGWMEPTGRFSFTVESITADDWEIESEPVLITREQFDAAWSKYIKRFPEGEELKAMLKELDRVAKELGL